VQGPLQSKTSKYNIFILPCSYPFLLPSCPSYSSPVLILPSSHLSFLFPSCPHSSFLCLVVLLLIYLFPLLHPLSFSFPYCLPPSSLVLLLSFLSSFSFLSYPSISPPLLLVPILSFSSLSLLYCLSPFYFLFLLIPPLLSPFFLFFFFEDC
jgi:hypothetical protein